nr:hypothetical protein [Cytophagales bacterium]
MIEYVDYIGFIAGLIFSLSGIAQARKIIRYKGGESISLLHYTMMIIGMSLWSVYAILHEAWMFVLWNSVAITLQLAVVILTLHYERKRQQLPEQYDRRKDRQPKKHFSV